MKFYPEHVHNKKGHDYLEKKNLKPVLSCIKALMLFWLLKFSRVHILLCMPPGIGTFTYSDSLTAV